MLDAVFGHASLIQSPSLRRLWTRNIALIISAVLLLPLFDRLARSVVLTWVGVVGLASVAVALFCWRKKARAIFILPLIYLAGLVTIRFRVEGNEEAFGMAGVAFLVLCLAWFLTEAFWSPYADDLAEMQAFSNAEK